MASVGVKVYLEGAAEYRKNMSEMSSQTKLFQAQLKNLQSQVGKSTFSKSIQESKVLANELQTLRDKSATLAQRIREASDAYGEDSNEVRKLSTQYENLQAQINRVDAELKEHGGLLGAVGSQLKETGDKISAVGEKISGFGDKLTMGVTMPLVAIGTKGVLAFAEVDKTMQLTNATMGNSAEQAKLLSDAMKTAAANSTFGMSDAATATLNFARAGLTAEQAAAALAPAMNLAAGEGGELDTVSAGLTATINGFGDSFENTSKYADIFAAACNNSALDVNSLSDSMSVAAPIFAAAGYEVKDAALYMGVMANAGIDANTAANALKTGFARLVSPAKEGAEMMDKLGISVTNADGTMKDSATIQYELNRAFSDLSESEQIAAASAIFGKNQMSNWLALINTAPEDVWKLKTNLDGASISIDSFNEQLENINSPLKDMRANLAAVGVTEEEFNEALKMSGGDAESFAWGLAEVADGSMSADDIIKTMGGSLSDLQSVMDSTKGTTDEMAEAMMSGFGGSLEKLKSSIDVLVTSLGEALAPTIQQVADKIQSVVDWFNSLDSSQQEQIAQIAMLVAAIGPVLAIGGRLISGLGSIVSMAGSVSSFLGTIGVSLGAALGPILLVVAGIGALVAAFVALYNTNDEFKAKVDATWNEIRVLIGGIIMEIQDLVGEFMVALHAFWEEHGATITQVLQAAFVVISNIVTTYLTYVKDFIKVVTAIIHGDWQGAWEAIKNLFQNLWEGIKNIVVSYLEYVKAFITMGLELLWSVIGEKVERIKLFITQALAAIKNTISTVFNNIKSLVLNTLTNIYSTVMSKINAVINFVRNAANLVKSTVSDMISNITSTITGLLTKAWNWGSDFINGFKDGIKSGVQNVLNEVKNMAQGVKDMIHFSEPDKGPLKDFNSWPRDMMRQYAEGIENGRYLVQKAVSDVTADVAMMQPNTLSADEIYSAVNAGASNANITLVIGDREFGRQLRDMGVVMA